MNDADLDDMVGWVRTSQYLIEKGMLEGGEEEREGVGAVAGCARMKNDADQDLMACKD